MKISKNSEKQLSVHSESRDRLSELPDSLILSILGFLPMIDVVRTTLLSKRLKSLWTTVLYLNFDCLDNKMNNVDKLRNLVDRVLDSWRGIKIVRFSFSFVYDLEKSLTSDIDSWLHFAMEKKVEELHLCLPYRFRVSDVNLYLVPQHLYSCSWIRVLVLRSCELQIHGDVEWNQLKSLTFDGEGLSESVVNKILRGCPRLEELHLTLCDSKENLCIRSSSLKVLSIEKYLFDDRDKPSTHTEMSVWAPNLEILILKGVPYSKCLLMNVSSLSDVTFWFYGMGQYKHPLFSLTYFLRQTLDQIFPTIKHVERVTLSDWCVKVLGAVKKKHRISAFHNVKFLDLNVCFQEHEENGFEQIVGILGMFPTLKNLVLEITHKSLPKHAQNSLKLPKKIPSNLFLLQLKTVDVTWITSDDSVFLLIELLLKYARNLEKIVFRLKRAKPGTAWKHVFMASLKLQRMKRSSPTVEFIFC